MGEGEQMSVKSRKRAHKNGIDCASLCNPLPQQKQALRVAINQYGQATALFFVLSLVALLGGIGMGPAHLDMGAWGAGGLILGVFGAYGIALIRLIRIRNKLNAIHGAAVQLTEVSCKKITFLCRPISKYSSVVLCAIIVDNQRKAFCYVFPEGFAPSGYLKQHMRSRYVGTQMELTCYKNTSLIKTCPFQQDL